MLAKHCLPPCPFPAACISLLQPAMTAEARCRFLYLLNLLVPGPLGLVHLLAPR